MTSPLTQAQAENIPQVDLAQHLACECPDFSDSTLINGDAIDALSDEQASQVLDILAKVRS